MTLLMSYVAVWKKKRPQNWGQHDWLTIGLKVLAESGIEAVRVEPRKINECDKG